MRYVHDLETDKIEIDTGGREAWRKLPTAVSDEIKRYCVFSKSRGVWISKAKAGNFWQLDKLTEWGFEDGGKINEKLSIEQKVEIRMARAEAKAERYEDRADRAQAESDRLHKRSHELVAGIEPGQPVLVGHHSERHHRRALDLSWNALGNAVGASEKAAYYKGRAASAQKTADGAQLKDPRYLGNRIKERQADIRTWEARLQGKFYQRDEPAPEKVTPERRDFYQGKLDDAQDELDFFEACLANCGVTVWDKEKLKGMTHVLTRHLWMEVIRVNRISVSCVNTLYQTEESNRKFAYIAPFTEIKDAKRIEAKKEEAS